MGCLRLRTSAGIRPAFPLGDFMFLQVMVAAHLLPGPGLPSGRTGPDDDRCRSDVAGTEPVRRRRPDAGRGVPHGGSQPEQLDQ